MLTNGNPIFQFTALWQNYVIKAHSKQAKVHLQILPLYPPLLVSNIILFLYYIFVKTNLNGNTASKSYELSLRTISQSKFVRLSVQKGSMF